MVRVLVTTGLFPPEIGGPATYSKFLKEKLPLHGFEVEVLPFREVRKYWKIVRHLIFFFKVLARGRHADIIYAQDTLSVGWPSAWANLFLRKHLVVRVPGDHVWEQGARRFEITEPLHEFPVFSRSWHPVLMLMRVLQWSVVCSAEALVVPSKYMQKIVRRWPVNPKRVHLIYNGVESFGDTGNKSVLRGLIKFQGKLIVSIGRLVPWKGFSKLIEFMPLLKQEFPDSKLLIIGGGPDLNILEEKVEALELTDDVIFAGEVEREVLIRYIRASDVFVLNSRYEGLSHQLLEVMAVGIPVIASAVGGNPEVITHEKDGYLVRPDSKDIVRYASNLLRDTALRTRIVQAAKRKVAQFSNEKMVSESARLLKTLCE